MNRRDFLQQAALAAAATGSLSRIPALQEREKYPTVRIGICADLHQDFIADAPRRLSAFMDDMLQKKPDFIIQMGDFCRPLEANKVIMDIWNRFPGPRYHVIGNHDVETDKFSRQQLMDFWQGIAPYYSFDIKGYHCIVLDANERNPEHETQWKYERFITDKQIQWLENDLQKTSLPVIVFCHQGLDNDLGGVENAVKIRLAFDRANQQAGYRKVQLVFTGHHHQDYHNVINGIHYVQINSASYHWQGNKYAESPFSAELNKEYPLMKYMAHYKDPLWAVVDISPDGSFQLQGRQSVFIGHSPAELGMPPYEYAYPVVPYISNRKVQLTMQPFKAEE